MSFSLKSLLLAFVYVRLVCAALLSPQPVWAQTVELVTFLAVILAAIVALYGPASRRPSRGGFAIAAGAYLAMTVYPGNFAGFPTTPLFEWTAQQLYTTRVRLWTTTADLVSATKPPLPGMASSGEGWVESMSYDSRGIVVTRPLFVNGSPVSNRVQMLAITAQNNTTYVGHCLFAMLLGLAAGEVARRSARRTEQQPAAG